jgi:medium-chain acyl-[acyl-carrier-protein] hydrolase
MHKKTSHTDPQLRLFCFPYAGGSSWIFHSWADAFPREIAVHPVELPGHGKRFSEPLVTRMNEMVDKLVVDLQPLLDRPCAFFGHSMGAKIGFELALRLERHGLVSPKHVFVSAATPHRRRSDAPPIHSLPTRRFLDELRSLNGTPPEVFEDAELLNFVIPVLRADFALDYAAEKVSPSPIGCPISAFVGSEDPQAKSEHALEWQFYTTSDFRVHMVPGGHFYLHAQRQELLQVILGELLTTFKKDMTNVIDRDISKLRLTQQILVPRCTE